MYIYLKCPIHTEEITHKTASDYYMETCHSK